MNEVNLQEEIVKVARDLFERSGRVEEHDLDNWLEGERIVMTQHRQQVNREAKIPAKKITSRQRGVFQEKLKQEHDRQISNKIYI